MASFASLDRVCDRWSSDDESLVEYAGQLAQGSQFLSEGLPMGRCDLGSELEEHCKMSVSGWIWSWLLGEGNAAERGRTNMDNSSVRHDVRVLHYIGLDSGDEQILQSIKVPSC